MEHLKDTEKFIVYKGLSDFEDINNEAVKRFLMSREEGLSSYISKLVSWIERMVFNRMSKRTNFLLTRINDQRLEIVADGNSDKNKDDNWRFFIDSSGDLVIQIRISSTWTSYIKVDTAGVTYIGDAGVTNYLKIEADGTLEFNGNATIFNDLVVPLSSARVPAANAPSWSGFIGNLKAYTYGVNDFQEISTELAHSYKEASTIEFHVHGAVNGSDVDERTIKFEIEYTIADIPAEGGLGDVYPSTTTINGELTIPASTTDLTAFSVDLGDDTTGNFIQGAIIKGRIRRITSSGSEPSSDPFLTEVGIHIESNTVGTRTATTK